MIAKEEEVKKILKDNQGDIAFSYSNVNALENEERLGYIARQICQLFEKELRRLRDERDDWKATVEVASNPKLSKILLNKSKSKKPKRG